MANWDVKTAAASLEFDTQKAIYNSCNIIDTNHFINFWQGVDADGFVQVFTVNTSTWAVTTASSTLNFDTNENYYNYCVKIDSNHFINFWASTTTAGIIQTFVVNTSTWAVTTAANSTAVGVTFLSNFNASVVDSNHIIYFYSGSLANNYARVATVNTSNWTISLEGTALTFDTKGGYNSSFKIDDNHFINFWQGVDADGFVQVFTVNTSTWAVTTASSALEFDTQDNKFNSCYQIDSNHFINFWAGPDDDGFVQVFTVNTSTWAVTTSAASLEFDTQNGLHNKCVRISDNNFINFWQGSSGGTGRSQVFTVNTSTWAVTTASDVLGFDTQTITWNSCNIIDTNHFINFWSDTDSDGKVQTFEVSTSATATGNFFQLF